MLKSRVFAGLACLFLWGLQPVAQIDSSHVLPPNIKLDQVRTRIDQASKDKAHPRLLADASTLESWKGLAGEDSLRGFLAREILRQAELVLNEPTLDRSLQGRRLLGQSRRCLERIARLATAWYLTGNKDYATRCEKEMLAVSAFIDWNPSHFLDVAEMTFALALGYDWLFHEIQPSNRSIIRRAMVEKSLELPFTTRHNGWVKSRNNWGQVCHGGLTAGALAVMEDHPDLAARTVHQALQNVVYSMEAFAPKGSYPEGPGYWAYGTTYNVLLIAVLESVLGSDFGLSMAPGFDQTGQYLALATGPSGLAFNYSDGGARRGPEPVLFWFAERYNRPDWLLGEDERFRAHASNGGRFLPLALLWMKEEPEVGRIAMPLHWNSGGEVPISIHRNKWEGSEAAFLGFKGGSPSANHGNMDIGSFVLDFGKVRWALDLGAEGYHGIEARGMNLWDRSQDSERWTIFRQMNHGHNTLVIDDQLQKVDGFGKFVAFSDDPARPFSILDMSSVYEGQATSVHRGVTFFYHDAILIRDELRGLTPGSKLRWGMITPAQPGSFGESTITLHEGDQVMQMMVVSPAQSIWKRVESATPRNEWDSPNPGTTQITFEVVAPEDGTLDLVVLAKQGTIEPSMIKDMDGLKRELKEWDR